MHKKILLGIAIASGLIISIGWRSISIFHWLGTGFDVSGWHWSSPILFWIGLASYFGVLALTPQREHWYFWVLGLAGVVFTAFLTYGVFFA